MEYLQINETLKLILLMVLEQLTGSVIGHTTLLLTSSSAVVGDHSESFSES